MTGASPDLPPPLPTATATPRDAETRGPVGHGRGRPAGGPPPSPSALGAMDFDQLEEAEDQLEEAEDPGCPRSACVSSPRNATGMAARACATSTSEMRARESAGAARRSAPHPAADRRMLPPQCPGRAATVSERRRQRPRAPRRGEGH